MVIKIGLKSILIINLIKIGQPWSEIWCCSGAPEPADSPAGDSGECPHLPHPELAASVPERGPHALRLSPLLRLRPPMHAALGPGNKLEDCIIIRNFIISPHL